MHRRRFTYSVYLTLRVSNIRVNKNKLYYIYNVSALLHFIFDDHVVILLAHVSRTGGPELHFIFDDHVVILSAHASGTGGPDLHFRQGAGEVLFRVWCVSAYTSIY